MTEARNRPGAAVWLGVAIAGLAGTELRYLLALLFPEGSTTFPFTTLSINVAGSLGLGLLAGIWSVRPADWWLRAALGPGFLGSFTTFSAVVYAVDQFARLGLPGLWLLYLPLSIVAGLAAAWLGLRAGTGWALRREAMA